MCLNCSPLVIVNFLWISALGVQWFPRAQRARERAQDRVQERARFLQYSRVTGAGTGARVRAWRRANGLKWCTVACTGACAGACTGARTGLSEVF